jgi:FKBP-type peptidyl-prolyl cis-trans isomerase FkpA
MKSPLWSFALALVTGLAGCNPQEPPPSPVSTSTASPTAPPEELQIVAVVAGSGAQIAAGSTAVVHYTGWLFDPAAPEHKGRKFDSSRDRGQPFRFPLGAGRVIQGWDRGVLGMKVGGQRRLVIPADLAYGARGAGGVIPPDAALVFDVELVAIEDESEGAPGGG